MTQEVICEQTVEGKVYWLVRKDEVEIECLHCCFRDDYNLCSTATECSNHEGSYFVEGEEVKQSLSNWVHNEKVYKLVSESPDDLYACDKCAFGSQGMADACELAGDFCRTKEGAYLVPLNTLEENTEKEVNNMQEKEASALDKQVAGGHYKDLKIQPVEYIVANNLSFLEGNIVKYTTRHRMKGGAEDIKKVIHYCELILELEYGKDKVNDK